MKIILNLILSAAFLHPLIAAEPPEQAISTYRAELAACRTAHGGSYDVPDVKFFLFGMGARTKLLYRDGILFDAKSGREFPRSRGSRLSDGATILYMPRPVDSTNGWYRYTS